jgi:CBS domain-containing protein
LTRNKDTGFEGDAMKRWYVSDVMTGDVVTVAADTGYKQIADLLVERAVSAVPVVDDQRRVLGVVSEADLLAKLQYPDRLPRHPLMTRRTNRAQRKAAGDTAAELMSAPAVTIRATATVEQSARLMDAARVKRLPVLDAAERLVGIVSRRDLVRLYTRSDQQIRASVVNDLLSALWIDPRSVQVSVKAGVVTLRGGLDRRSTTSIVASFTQAIPGVVDVIDELTYDLDDGDLNRSHRYSRSVLRG